MGYSYTPGNSRLGEVMLRNGRGVGYIADNGFDYIGRVGCSVTMSYVEHA